MHQCWAHDKLRPGIKDVVKIMKSWSKKANPPDEIHKDGMDKTSVSLDVVKSKSQEQYPYGMWLLGLRPNHNPSLTEEK